ncbi:dTDP-fucosamine acetyltransferase [anaerobic digester metagenome]
MGFKTTFGTMKLEYLDWDSHFFQLKTGRVTLDPGDQSDDLKRIVQENPSFKLLYVFSLEDNLGVDLLPHCFLVDRKVTYLYQADENTIYPVSSLGSDFDICSFEGENIPADLECLALQSGAYSRFRIDPFFSNDAFVRLYKTWIENSVLRKICDDVFVVKSNAKIVGFVTVKYLSNYCKIGLIAVDPNYRGKGIGTMLIQAVVRTALGKGIFKVFVDTQLDNELACLFYEKNNFTANQVHYIYHYWNNL